MKNILVVGSINMDYTVYVNEFPKNGETIFGSTRIVQPGGKGANQAVAVAKSGLANCFFKAAVGDDGDGHAIIKQLKEFGVKTDIKTSKKETGNATIVVDKNSENKIVIVGGANTDLNPEDVDVKLIEKCDYVILQNEIPDKTNEFVIKKAHELGKIVVYNPAPFRKIDTSLFKCIDYFTPNKGELLKYANCSSLDEAIDRLLSFGVKNLIVTLGSKGCMFVSKKEKIQIGAYKVKAIDTVAAGDTFVGYFTSALASGKDLVSSLKIAAKASSITVSRKGSLISIPFGKEVKI